MAVPIHRPLAEVPTLDQIAADPRCVAGLQQSTVRDLLRRCAVVQSMLVVELKPEDGMPQHGANGQEDDRLLTAKEAAEMLRRSVRWLYRKKHTLPFVRKISPRTFVCSQKGIKQWLERRGPLNS
jgi:predicted DNA-binding transcriptional regulator AlpA